MEARAEFVKKLNELVAVAEGQGNQVTIDEVKLYFADTGLTDEQLELVFDYLLAQKVVVKGYIKMTEDAEEKLAYTEEEEAYLKEYLNDLKAFKALTSLTINSCVIDKKAIAAICEIKTLRNTYINKLFTR